MERLVFYFFLILFISGCTATSKTARPVVMPTAPEAVIETKAITEPPEIKKESKSLSISYSQVTNVISEFLDIRAVEDLADGQRFLGTSENNLVSLEIIGSMDDVSLVSMSLVYPKGMEAINADLNNAMVLRFLRNIAPEFKDWSSRTNDILSKFYAMNIGRIEEEKIMFGRKAMRILYDKNTDSITFTIESE